LNKEAILNILDANSLVKPLAIFSIIVCLFTWGLDLAGLVYVCPYCQTQRTMIGLVGIVLLLPWKNLITDYLVLVFGLFGAYVAALQMFNNFYKSAWNEEFIYLATCAFLILVAQLLVNFQRKQS
jgi:hypothetical protein